MAIDAVVSGVVLVGDDVKLVLDKRDEQTPADQQTLVIQEPLIDSEHVGDLIGCEVWGNASQLMLRNAKLANRIGYTTINLVPHWRELVKAYK